MSKQELETTETRNLICQLTEHELMERGNELAQELKGITELIQERAVVNAKIKPKEQRVEKLVTIIDTKEEVREIECDWSFDWNRGVKTLYRSDTHEKLESKPITDAERQIQLELTGQDED